MCKSRTVVSLIRVFRTNTGTEFQTFWLSKLARVTRDKSNNHPSVSVPFGDLSSIERKSVLMSLSFTGQISQIMLEPRKIVIIMLVTPRLVSFWDKFPSNLAAPLRIGISSCKGENLRTPCA